MIGHQNDLSLALNETRERLQTVSILFEAAFEHAGILVRTDLLSRENDGYHIVEVKSSTRIKDYHVKDAAIQSWVIEGAGITLSSVEIACIHTDFIYRGDGDYQGIFRFERIDPLVNDLKRLVPTWIEQFSETLAGPGARHRTRKPVLRSLCLSVLALLRPS
ncbi:MAG: hypothetical protein MZV64_71655 [Ignavibacteriales bacterium]|nr:hypothetical protein [Ignavibacteriales bacterium]